MKNKFIVIEGLEGSGKTTACLNIKNLLHLSGIKNIVIVREPGSTEIGEKIRKLIKKKFKEKIVNETELLLMFAARKQLLETIIKPELKKGTWIISDRFYLSSYSYQGGGAKIELNFIEILRKFLLGNLYPDLTIYLDVDPITGLNRVIKSRKNLDRIEMKKIDFFNRTRKIYLKLINSDPKSIIIDANQNINFVKQSIKNSIKNWLKIKSL